MEQGEMKNVPNNVTSERQGNECTWSREKKCVAQTFFFLFLTRETSIRERFFNDPNSVNHGRNYQ